MFEQLQRAEGSTLPSAIRIGIDRLNRAYTRTSPEDAVIDITIGLEATVLHGLRDELKYRLSLRTAALIPERAAEIAEFMRHLYDARSAIVHNGKSLAEAIRKIDSRDPQEFVDIAIQTYRQILLALLARLRRQPNFSEVAGGLDCEVISALSKKAVD